MVDVEVSPWIKGLPVAPEYHPTEAEFADPITFLLRIEEEAGQFGICKIVPPVPKPPRKSVLSNLSRSIAAAQAASQGRQVSSAQDANSLSRSKFATRRQQLGLGNKDVVHKVIWQKGASHTLEQFETKAKAFSRGQLGTCKDVAPIALETLFWDAVEKDEPIFVEYAKDIPGSVFPENGNEQADGKKRKKCVKEKEVTGWKLANSSWNMRYLSQLQGSLLRFMPNDVQGVTSPLLCIAMLFSWSAWHTEEHELHNLNFLHLGAPKTWYAVPPEAASAFEEVVRVYGFGEQVDSEGLSTKLAEENIILSPEVLVSCGVPCCRLVQNPGEFIVTFPRSYNIEINHGFSCSEACSFATPGWLKVAKQAAIRRIAMDRTPIFCHEQLLYQSALAFSESSNATETRSSRLKNKKKVCVEEAVRTEFVSDVIKNRQVLEKLVNMARAKCILLKNGTSTTQKDITGDGEKENICNLVNLGTIDSISLLSFVCESMEGSNEKGEDHGSAGSRPSPAIEWGALSCAVCGILCYSCIAIIHPTPESSKGILAIMATELTGNKMVAKNDATRNNVKRKHHVNGLAACSTRYEGEDETARHTEVLLKSLTVRRNGTKDISAIAAAEDSKNDITSACLPPCVLCSDHALQVYLQLRSFGGSQVLVVYHPEYQAFEKNAKQIANDMGINFSAKDVVFEKGNEDDFHLISMAMDAGPRNNWAAHIPLDSQLMAHSAVTDRDIMDADEEDELLVEKTLKEKKCWVVGRWCGRVWRYDQTHVLLGGSKSATQALKAAVEASHAETYEESDNDTSRKRKENSVEDEEIKQKDDDHASLGIAKKNCRKRRRTQMVAVWRVESEPQPHCREPPVQSITGSFYEEDQADTDNQVQCKDGSRPEPGSTMPAASVEEVSVVTNKPEVDSMNEDHTELLQPGSSEEPATAKDDCKSAEPHSLPELESQSGEFEEEIQKKVDSLTKPEAFQPVLNDELQNQLSLNEVHRNDENEERSARPASDELPAEDCRQGDTEAEVLPAQSVEEGREGSTLEASAIMQEEEQQTVRAVGSTLCFSNSVWHDVPISFSPTFHSSYYNRGTPEGRGVSWQASFRTSVKAEPGQRSNDRVRLQTRKNYSEVSADDECFEAEVEDELFQGEDTEASNQEDDVDSDVSTSSVQELFTSVDDHAEDESHQGADDGLICRAKRTKRKSWKALAAEDERPAKASKKTTGAKKTTMSARKALETKKKPAMEAESPEAEELHVCDFDGCTMSFRTASDLALHKRNICTIKECGKRLCSHSYLMQHYRVHVDDRPLKCPWKGCKKTFKWSWARTEHIRVHTGERPYTCNECGKSYRFVSDFSRHKRTTGHNT